MTWLTDKDYQTRRVEVTVHTPRLDWLARLTDGRRDVPHCRECLTTNVDDGVWIIINTEYRGSTADLPESFSELYCSWPCLLKVVASICIHEELPEGVTLTDLPDWRGAPS